MGLHKPGKTWTERVDGTPLPTSASRFSLAEQAADWHFFNHGAFFAFGGLTFKDADPVADWYHQQPIGTQVIRQPFKNPVLAGLHAPTGVGALTWDHLVMAVRHEYWQSLWEFLGGIVTVDGDKQRYCQTFSGDIDIVDPVFAERHSLLHPDLPKIKMTVFCIDANDARWEVRPSAVVAMPPRFVRMPARPEVVEIGRAIMAGRVEALQNKDNPAFQPLLDKYAQISRRGTDADTNGDANHR